MKKDRGITLIALIITIIILIILAGISIGVLANTGLFEKAKEAKQKTNEAEQLEINRLSEYENVIEQYSGNEKNTLEPGLYNDGVMTATWSELIENDILIYSDYDNSIKAEYGKSDSLVGKLWIYVKFLDTFFENFFIYMRPLS